ncbi:MFS transporter [Phialemonium atrogriseum]|uniref:MFS transporter n=1 Tax=Phialemonium atrogriseum TaxID=1093897 RepID=A0AAJ0C750_9PEZI|nr:MFS transporter [Phialemonium atrogriseum]KAK1768921.1 MFS transporter [Phialemonium atrogriseum]
MSENAPEERRRGWRAIFGKGSVAEGHDSAEKPRQEKWSMGILNDPLTIEVPGSVLLLARDRNEPLGLRNAPARTSASSIPITISQAVPQPQEDLDKKKTSDGKIILVPQPEESANDPLNWPSWRRDLSLLSLGLYCMVGGGITPLLAAGFTDVSKAYGVPVADVSLTTGLYMMGMGIGSVFFSPTAILWGKRPVYLFSVILLIATSVWCAASPNFPSLIVARIFQGIAVSPVECLPSATIAEIFFLHERAFRIGIYTLLLLGGKNLVPLVSAAVMQRLGWRWVFWMVAIVVGFCGFLLFLFVPETFWDRAAVGRKSRKSTSRRPSFSRRRSSKYNALPAAAPDVVVSNRDGDHGAPSEHESPHQHAKSPRVEFAPSIDTEHGQPVEEHATGNPLSPPLDHQTRDNGEDKITVAKTEDDNTDRRVLDPTPSAINIPSAAHIPGTPNLAKPRAVSPGLGASESGDATRETDSERQSISSSILPGGFAYTATLREQPARSFTQQLKPYHGRLHRDKWHKVAVRPLILFMYPAVLWSSVVYACSVGWLIVISETMAVIFREGIYKFNALQTGLIYISPFLGGILGTLVAGKVSDVVVRSMTRRNGGLYEPEFRLVMAAPIVLSTVIGLMGFGWSAQDGDHWIVPTVFFGVVSFGCFLGSTTSITFCVDSYRQYAGEALVTLNFSKNIFHGLVFSLFITGWVDSDGSKSVFIWLGVIQLILLTSTIPLYIYGKRARMWTVRKNFMEKF